MCTNLDTHYHLLCREPAAKELRSMKEYMRLTVHKGIQETHELEALEFVRLFDTKIAKSVGGVYGLLKEWNEKLS